jgi:uncharacterized protein
MLGFILICFSILLGFVRGGSFPQILSYFVQALTEPATLQLLGVITLIEMLTIFLELTGSLNRILAALRKVIEDPRALIAIVPSFLGVFPVPGGAMLSAPMVKVYGEEIGFHADQKSSINLFFRHVWDLVIPFKPHMILAASVSNIPLFTLIGWHFPVSIATVFVGYWFLIGRYPKPNITHVIPPNEVKPGLPLWIEVAPLVFPLVLSLGFRISFFYSMTIGLLFGLLTQRVSRPMMKRVVKEGIRPKLLFLLASVMIFKTVLENTDIVKIIAATFTTYGIALEILVFTLPLFMGFLTGMELVGVGVLFPLLLGMIPEGRSVLPYLIVMMTANSTGQVFSPAHVCMVVGNEYFGVSLSRVIQMNLLPQLFRLIAASIFAWILYLFWF